MFFSFFPLQNSSSSVRLKGNVHVQVLPIWTLTGTFWSVNVVYSYSVCMFMIAFLEIFCWNMKSEVFLHYFVLVNHINSYKNDGRMDGCLSAAVIWRVVGYMLDRSPVHPGQALFMRSVSLHYVLLFSGICWMYQNMANKINSLQKTLGVNYTAQKIAQYWNYATFLLSRDF